MKRNDIYVRLCCRRSRRSIVFGFFILVCVAFFVLYYKTPQVYCQSKALRRPVRIGYFHGGRTHALYRTYVYNLFDKENVDVEFYSQYLRGDKFVLVPNQHERMKDMQKAGNLFGKVTGERIIKAIEDGVLDGGTPGESSFIEAVNNGSPIVAVALLGHDNKDKPGKALLLRKDVVIKKPQDFIGKKFGTRRAGPGDKIFLSEFFRSIGLDPEKDVTIIDQIPDDEQRKCLKAGTLDGMLHHLHGAIREIENDVAYLYRPMDWMNPEISYAVLVFRRDFVTQHPKEVEKVVRAYMKRLKYEHSLPLSEKVKPLDFGLQIELHYKKSMVLPQFDFPPLVRMDLLKQVQDLLLQYKIIDKKNDLSKYVDNSFVERIYEEIK